MTDQSLPKGSEQLISQYLHQADDQKIAELAGLARGNSQLAQQLAQLVEANPDEEITANAIRALGEANPALLEAPLRHMLESRGEYSDYTTRATGAYLAGVYQLASLKDALENLLRTDDSADVRYWCAASLGEVGDLSSLPVLQKAAQDDGWADNQQTVASAAQNALLMIDQRSKL